jgi:hypothetical protein
MNKRIKIVLDASYQKARRRGKWRWEAERRAIEPEAEEVKSEK